MIGEEGIPKRETRNLTVTVGGENRAGTWKQGVGIYVSGHDFGKGEAVEIGGRRHELVKVRRMLMEGEAVSLIVEGRDAEE